MSSALYIVLPAYNEEESLREMIPDVLQAVKSLGQPCTICVVNDGSSDGTAQVADSFAGLSVRCVTHPINRGYGAAIRTGVAWVLERAQPEDFLITMDSDNTQPPRYIRDLIAKLQDGYGVVTASYRMTGGAMQGVPWKRRVLSGVVNALFMMRFRFSGVRTYTNGFRGYRTDILRRLQQQFGDQLIEQTGFAGGTELFIRAIRAGARAGEVPFVLQYDRRGDASKIRIGRTILGYLRLLAN